MPDEICKVGGRWKELKESMLVCKFCGKKSLTEWEYDEEKKSVVPKEKTKTGPWLGHQGMDAGE